MTIIGIDPGACGCVAWDQGSALRFACLDTGDPAEVVDRLFSIKAFCSDVERVVIERTHTMPKMGAASAFTFGQSTGVLLGACAALHFPIERVSAQEWQASALRGNKHPGDRPARMAAIVSAAQLRWPTLEWPKAKKHREALSSALWLRETAVREEATRV